MHTILFPCRWSNLRGGDHATARWRVHRKYETYLVCNDCVGEYLVVVAIVWELLYHGNRHLTVEAIHEVAA